MFNEIETCILNRYKTIHELYKIDKKVAIKNLNEKYKNGENVNEYNDILTDLAIKNKTGEYSYGYVLNYLQSLSIDTVTEIYTRSLHRKNKGKDSNENTILMFWSMYVLSVNQNIKVDLNNLTIKMYGGGIKIEND